MCSRTRQTRLRKKSKRRRIRRTAANVLLQCTRDFTIAVVEAKSEDRPAGEGLQQAKEYIEVLA